MLKGTLEGIVLALLADRSAYGSAEITAWLREQGFTDIAEGTVYARSSGWSSAAWSTSRRCRPRRGRPARSTRSTREVGPTSTSSGGRGAFSRNASNSSAKEAAEMAAEVDRGPDRVAREKKHSKRDKARMEALPEPYRSAAKAFTRYFMYWTGGSPTATPW